MTAAQNWIERLELRRHPEGGWFRETYRCQELIAKAALPSRFTGDRAFSTAIYFLLDGVEFSALHRIQQDEVFHFYDGSALTLHVIDPQGSYSTVKVGRNLMAGELPQAIVNAGSVFGATVDDTTSYALVGCTVAPGFDFADFTLPARDELCRQFPEHRQLIERLTRETTGQRLAGDGPPRVEPAFSPQVLFLTGIRRITAQLTVDAEECQPLD